jgi:hypothetical protein
MCKIPPEGKLSCGCDAVLCVISFLEKSGYATGSGANADGSGSSDGKSN